MTERVFVDTPGGTLEVHLAGPESGIPLLYHHGTPGAGLPYGPLADAASARGLRLVAPTRPGYGDSSRRPGRSVADCAADAVAVLDELGSATCLAAGWSGGGPHALACAALLPERVLAAAAIAGVAPADAEELDWTAGMGEENVAEFDAARNGPDALAPFLEGTAAELAGAEAGQLADALGDLVPDVDRAALSGELAEWIAATFRAATRQGTGGWVDDDMAFVRPWGFELGAVTVPVTLWQGDLDRMVPLAHGPWLAAHVPGAVLRVERGHGHLSLFADRVGPILDDLVARGGVSART